MSFLFTNILIGIGLSMDAFSLSILYGTLNLSKKKIIHLSMIVGGYHLCMPLFGHLIGENVLAKYILDPEFLIGVIFAVIAFQMLISLKKEEEVKSLNGIGALLLFGLTVSMDSFSVGMGFGTLNHTFLSVILSAIIFCLVSFVFTFTGLSIGASFSKRFGKVSNLIGSLILLGLAIYYFLI